jgi:archaeoflavoprotein AfpA
MSRIAWGITGSGDKIEEIYSVMEKICDDYSNVEVRVFVSKAGEQVLRWYKLFDKLKTGFQKLYVEINSNAPFLAGEVQVGKYDFMLIAPATSNSVAKMALGIGDTMITNAASMAMKSSIPIYILPSDYEVGVTTTKLPNGKDLEMKILEKDVNHVKSLGKHDHVYILRDPQEIISVFSDYYGRI